MSIYGKIFKDNHMSVIHYLPCDIMNKIKPYDQSISVVGDLNLQPYYLYHYVCSTYEAFNHNCLDF